MPYSVTPNSNNVETNLWPIDLVVYLRWGAVKAGNIRASRQNCFVNTMSLEGCWVQSREEKFDWIFFPEATVQDAVQALADTVEGESSLSWSGLSTRTGNVTCNYANADEFFVDYGPAIGYGRLGVTVRPKQGFDYYTRSVLSLSVYPAFQTTVTVKAPARFALLRAFAVLRAWAEKKPPPFQSCTSCRHRPS